MHARGSAMSRGVPAPHLGLIPCPHMLGNDLSQGKHREIGGGSLMRYRLASAQDCPMLAVLNAQLIQDEGHRNPMTVAQLEDRMREWLTSGEYQALLWEDHHEVVAYALFRETTAEVYLRQFFVVRHRRREGIGRQAIAALLTQV